MRSVPPGVAVVDVDEPDGEGELIRIRSASICASDFAYIRWGSQHILGHELAGETEAGVPVAIEAIFGCGTCVQCRSGHYNRCPELGGLGMTAAGGMSTWFRAPGRALVPLPPGLPVNDACLVEPASVAWHACRIGHVGPETRVAVVGGGAIGLLAGVAAQTMGAAEVDVEVRHRHQAEAAERLDLGSPSDLYDVVIETGGSESSLHRCVELARPGGTMVVVGVHDASVAWPHQAAFTKELVTAPALGYCGSSEGNGREFGEAAAMLGARPELVELLITHRFGLEEAPEAFRVASDKSAGARRVVVHPD